MLRSEINRCYNNHMNVSMMVSTKYKMRKELQQVKRELEDCKKKCEEFGQNTGRLMNKVEEEKSKEIE